LCLAITAPRWQRSSCGAKLWNRMSSGSYFPGPVRAVEIPKDHGAGVRVLGVPNTVDRIAQTAAAMLLEEKLEPIFHQDSYGYRPGRSAHDALAVARQRCWKKDWVLDLDVRAFFDSVPHDLLLKAVAHHTDERWVLLYIERWLTAPMQMVDGTLLAREKGTPQGSPISPLLANLFMHYAFDKWMDREYSGSPRRVETNPGRVDHQSSDHGDVPAVAPGHLCPCPYRQP
jgi:RNA-directed DNA polymerase